MLRLAWRIDNESIEPRLLRERAVLPLRPFSTSAAYWMRPARVSWRSSSPPATAALVTWLSFSIALVDISKNDAKPGL